MTLSTDGDAAAVVDASALVDLLLGGRVGSVIAPRIRRGAMHVPAHIDAEVLSAHGRMHRAGVYSSEQVDERLGVFARMPLIRHPLPPLLTGAWARRENLRLADALYVELAEQLDVPLVTTDRRLAAVVRRAELPGE